MSLKVIQPSDKRSYRYTGFPIRTIAVSDTPNVNSLSNNGNKSSNSIPSKTNTLRDFSGLLPKTVVSSAETNTTLGIYLDRLLSSMNTRVVVINQEIDPDNPKRIIRYVDRIVSPGTLIESQMITQEAKYLTSITVLDTTNTLEHKDTLNQKSNTFAICWIDISIGVLSTTIGDIDHIKRHLSAINPVEILLDNTIYNENIILNQDEKDTLLFIEKTFFSHKIKYDDSYINNNNINDYIIENIEELNEKDNISLQNSTIDLNTYKKEIDTPTNKLSLTEKKGISNILNYMKEVFPTKSQFKIHLKPNSNINSIEKQSMILDETSQQSLEIIRSLNNRTTKFSLFNIINKTMTSGGRRLLQERLLEPSMDLSLIRKRHDLVQLLIDNDLILKFINQELKPIGDLERMVQKIECNICDFDNYHELRNNVNHAKYLIEGITERLDALNINHFPTIDLPKCLNLSNYCLNKLPEIFVEINGEKEMVTGICESFDMALNEYNRLHDKMDIIKSSILNIDGLEHESSNFNSCWDLSLTMDPKTQQPICILRSGSIKARKFLQCKINHLPENSIKILSDTKSAIKFVYNDWTTLHSEIFRAGARLELARKEYLSILKNYVSNVSEDIRIIAKLISSIDVSSSFAKIAILNNYTKPNMVEESIHDVVGGRHPVVESAQLNRGLPYYATDYKIDENNKILLITGPNMGGKSTLLRQAALISIMAQAGSFVAADSATLGLVDCILSRIGACDDLASHKSTFMVEMSETSKILKMATEKSFVIIDELGRGTSTRDGVSIAYAVLLYLHNISKCRGIFATHYMELAKLIEERKNSTDLNESENFSKISCYKTEVIHVMEDNERLKYDLGQILCTYKLIPGIMESSFGIHVARSAGLPNEVIYNASKTSEQIFGKL